VLSMSETDAGNFFYYAASRRGASRHLIGARANTLRRASGGGFWPRGRSTYSPTSIWTRRGPFGTGEGDSNHTSVTSRLPKTCVPESNKEHPPAPATGKAPRILTRACGVESTLELPRRRLHWRAPSPIWGGIRVKLKGLLEIFNDIEGTKGALQVN